MVRVGFKETSRFVQADANSRKNFDVRKREWVRQAQVRAVIEEELLPGEVEKTEAELEEERKQEILQKAAQYVSRVPRRGTLKLTVTSGEALFQCAIVLSFQYIVCPQHSAI